MALENAEKVVMFLFIFLPSLVCALMGYMLGYFSGRRVGRKRGTQKVHQDAVRTGAAVWEADASGSPVIKWRSPGSTSLESTQQPSFDDAPE